MSYDRMISFIRSILAVISMLFGQQFIITIENCSESFVNDFDNIVQSAIDLSHEFDLDVIDHISHEFTPFGFTAILILAQSHLAIHTWPEHQTVIIDLFCCRKDFDIDQFAQRLKEISGSNLMDYTCTFSR
jgi:S-adenosylmethionine decarboxylase proenzyme